MTSHTRTRPSKRCHPGLGGPKVTPVIVPPVKHIVLVALCMAAACATSTSTGSNEGEPASAASDVVAGDAPTEPAVVQVEPSSPEPKVAPVAPASGPWTAFSMPTNCQARLALTEEVTRLLTRAAAHSTASAACVDGPGKRVAATDVLVCPAAGNGSDTVVSVYYRMATYPEGDTRGCQQPGRSCDWLTPTASEHRVELRFETDAKGRARLRAPSTLPGMSDDATALDHVHDGNCYGVSPKFEPQWVTP